MGRFLGSLLTILFARGKQAIFNVLQFCKDGWLRFWFTQTDPTLNSIMRIFAGSMLLYTHLVWSLKLDAFFGANGWQNIEMMRQFQAQETVFSFWFWVPENLLWPVHFTCLGIFVMYLLGVLTPVTKWLVYFITVSYAHRAQMANFGLDQMNAILAFYLALGPCGAKYSVDAWWKKRKLKRAGLPIPPVEKSASANLSMRFIQVHLCVIYIFAGISKLQGELWWNGFAVWNAAANLEYQSNSLLWLAHVPWLCNVLTLATIFWEISFAALVWNKKLRLIVLMIGAGMHLGIGAFLGMWTFGLIMTFMYLAFIPPDLVPKILNYFPELLAQARSEKDPLAAVPCVKQPTTLDKLQVSNSNQKPALSTRKRQLLVISEDWTLNRRLFEYFYRHQHPCLLATDLDSAQTMIQLNEIDGVILFHGRFKREDVQQFREELSSLEEIGPASITIKKRFKEADHNIHVSFSNRHQMIYGTPTLAEVRAMLFAAIETSTKTVDANKKKDDGDDAEAIAPDAATDTDPETDSVLDTVTEVETLT